MERGREKGLDNMIITGNALQLNGSTQYAGRAIVSVVTNNFSIILWVKLIALPGTGLDYCFFNNGITDANGYLLQCNDAGVFNCDFSFISNLSSGYTLSIDTWYQLAVIRNAGTTQCYVNATAQGGTMANTPNTPNNFVTIGASRTSTPTTNDFTNGYIDDVRMYERAISTTELTALYNYQLNTINGDISNTNLKSWWKLDETTGTNCADSSITGSALTTVNTPPFVQGIVEARRESPLMYKGIRPAPFRPGIAR